MNAYFDEVMRKRLERRQKEIGIELKLSDMSALIDSTVNLLYIHHSWIWIACHSSKQMNIPKAAMSSKSHSAEYR